MDALAQFQLADLGLPADVVARLQHSPAVQSLQTASSQLAWVTEPALAAADAWLDATLRPWQVAAAAVAVTLLAVAVALQLHAAWAGVREEGGVLQALFARLRRLPLVRGALRRRIARLRSALSADLHKPGGPQALRALPPRSTPPSAVLEMLRRRQARDVQLPSDGSSPLSGAVYVGDEKLKRLGEEVYSLYSLANPLHLDIFPSVRQMEAEVVAMTARMLGGGPGTEAPAACGAMTSGGTESILLAVKAARDWARSQRGVTAPEMVLGRSAHAAYVKAAEYFKVRIVWAHTGQDYRLHGAAVARCISRNTILAVASAPGFPHGVIDDVVGIAAAAARRRVLCHVDCCLGGFVLPWARRLGYSVPPFDFQVPGVTSISCDTHKFAQAAKGTSVVLYRTPELRAQQYTRITDWSGGLYISPSMAGSRPGALIAAAWAALVALGEEGLMAGAAAVMRAARELEERLAAQVPELELVGRPDMCLVAFKARSPKALNIYQLHSLLTARGWHLNALQFPPALHFCFTPASAGVAAPLAADIRAAVAQLAADPSAGRGGSAAPVYGMSGLSPDRGLVGEVLVAYQDCVLEA